MRTVYKYPMGFIGHCALELPVGATIVHFGAQSDVPMLWALVDTTAPMETRSFRLAGTGHPIESSLELNHIGTTSVMRGEIVVHLFEILNDIKVQP
jgi:hypothetical protein